MWIFARYGFFSIACAQKPDGTPDKDTVMIRARRAEHLENLRDRFPALAGIGIATTRGTDYRYRMILPKAVWVPVLAEMGEEQEWSNFKNEAAAYEASRGPVGEDSYSTALHEVWSVMNGLQR